MSGFAWVATQAALTSSARAGSRRQERAHLGHHQWVLKRDRAVGVRDLAKRRCNMCGTTWAYYPYCPDVGLHIEHALVARKHPLLLSTQKHAISMAAPLYAERCTSSSSYIIHPRILGVWQPQSSHTALHPLVCALTARLAAVHAALPKTFRGLLLDGGALRAAAPAVLCSIMYSIIALISLSHAAHKYT
ncbi:hypothetical protein FB451DRAFT_151630 [Mycena latifolia]|nr:hypothetical protein FB451DRAFT_151630 [Mycena latifolia]